MVNLSCDCVHVAGHSGIQQPTGQYAAEAGVSERTQHGLGAESARKGADLPRTGEEKEDGEGVWSWNGDFVWLRKGGGVGRQMQVPGCLL